MPQQIVDAALAWVAENALAQERSSFTVSFHGQGEPTANWPLFRYAILRAETLAREAGLAVEFTMSSNAMWGRAQCDFICEHFRHLSVSCDGLPKVQDLQRPVAGGAASAAVVWKNLRYLDKREVSYGLRATVLPTSISEMVPFLETVARELRCNWVHYEPVFATGRGEGIELHRGFFSEFLAEYRRAVRIGTSLGVSVAYSGCRPEHYSPNFCNVTGPDLNFFITTSGLVSSCYELIDPASVKGRVTVYGRYDAAGRSFVFDQPRLDALRRSSVADLEHCRDCFARWNCSGDCFARSDVTVDAAGNVVGSSRSQRCALNRATTRDALARIALASDALAYVGPSREAATTGRDAHEGPTAARD